MDYLINVHAQHFKDCDNEAMEVTTKAGQVIKVSKEIPAAKFEGEFIGMAKLSKKIMPAIKKASQKLMREGCLKSYFEGAIQEVIDRGGYSIPSLPANNRFLGEVNFEEDYDYVILASSEFFHCHPMATIGTSGEFGKFYRSRVYLEHPILHTC